MESQLWLSRAVDIRVLLGLHASVLVIKNRFNDAVSDGLK